MQGETNFCTEMKKWWWVTWGAQIYPWINNTASSLLRRERAAVKGRDRYCNFKGSEKQYLIFFRKKQTNCDCMAQYTAKITSESFEHTHTHIFPAHISVLIPLRLEVLLFLPVLPGALHEETARQEIPIRPWVRKRYKQRTHTSGHNSREQFPQKKTSFQDQAGLTSLSLRKSYQGCYTLY